MFASITSDFSFAKLVGSARGVSLARILFGILSLVAIKTSAITQIYAVNPLAFVILLCALSSAVAMIIGFWGRCATFLAGLILMLLYLCSEFRVGPSNWLPFEARESFGRAINQYFLASVVLMLSLTPCGRHFSLDSYRQHYDRGSTFNLYGVQLIRMQVCAMYLWTAFQKMNLSFLKGNVFETAWALRVVGSVNYTHTPTSALIFSSFGVVVIAVEMALGITLLIPSLRRYAVFAGIIFHLGAATVLPVAAFTFATITALILFLPPEAFDRFMEYNHSDHLPT